MTTATSMVVATYLVCSLRAITVSAAPVSVTRTYYRPKPSKILKQFRQSCIHHAPPSSQEMLNWPKNVHNSLRRMIFIILFALQARARMLALKCAPHYTQFEDSQVFGGTRFTSTFTFHTEQTNEETNMQRARWEKFRCDFGSNKRIVFSVLLLFLFSCWKRCRAPSKTNEMNLTKA